MATNGGVLTMSDALDIHAFSVDEPSEFRPGKMRSAGQGDAVRARLADGDFFKGKSISELAGEQGVGPVRDIRGFAGVIPEDEDVDQMLAEIYRLREPQPHKQ